VTRNATEQSFPRPVGDHARFSGLLAATTMGVYLLVIAGASTAVTDAAGACTTWPACNGQWIVGLDDPALLLAWGHRVAALLVGVAVLATAVVAWLGDADRRVRAAVALPLVLYPVQIGLGALAAGPGTSLALSAIHLAVGVSIFAGFVLALAWTLEPEELDEPEDVDLERPEGIPDDEVDPGPADPPGSALERVVRRAKAYLALTKPRLMWLLCLVAAAAMALAAGPDLDPRTVAATLAGGVLAIGASGTFNHVLERDVDRHMNRTSDRPLATDEVGVRRATAFGFLLAAASLAVFSTVNLLAAGLGLTAILFYSVVYTLLLKPNTVENTVIGGAAGALPALIGWAAVTGTIGLPGLLLATVIFLWTPAHFYNLALAYRDDYERGGFPMLPVVRGEAVTRKHILWYLGATLASAVLLGATTDLGAVYAGASVLLGSVFLWAVVRLHRERTTDAAFRAFHASNAYLGAILLAVVVDALAV
jgi:protoheme IX farnesyltransferase